MYVEYLGQKNNPKLTRNKIYKVLRIIEKYYYLIEDDSNIESIYDPNLFKIKPLLKVKYIGKDNFSLKKDKLYDVISIESGFSKDDSYRIIDETDGDYLFNKNDFEIIESNLDEIT
jgi:hypothetical protein